MKFFENFISYKILLAYFIFSFNLTSFPIITEKHFVIIITSYNNKDWYKKNLDSVFQQQYSNYTIIYIDDASSDGTSNLVELYIQTNRQGFRTILIKNIEWQSQMANHYKAVFMCNDDDIIVHLDGDDWLAHPHVLKYLNKIYSQEDVWITYGQLENWPYSGGSPCIPTPTTIITTNTFRQFGWIYGHLRTFYAWLFKEIKLKDLFFKGDFKNFSPSPDIGFMYPMLEMAGHHMRYIPEILYIWNQKNPISQYRINFKDQIDLINEVRSWQPYQPLTKKSNKFNNLSSNVIIISQDNIQNSDIYQKFASLMFPQITSCYHIFNVGEFCQMLDLKKPTFNKNIPYNYFKDELLNLINNIDKDYIVFSFDIPSRLSDMIDLSKYITVLNNTHAFALFLDFTSDHFQKNIPNETVFDHYGAWQFNYGNNILNKAVILKKETLLTIIKELSFDSIKTLKKVWSTYSLPPYEIGLFIR